MQAIINVLLISNTNLMFSIKVTFECLISAAYSIVVSCKGFCLIERAKYFQLIFFLSTATVHLMMFAVVLISYRLKQFVS